MTDFAKTSRLQADARHEYARRVEELPAAQKLHASVQALDELFSLTRQYRTSKEYLDLLDFAARFRSYAPYNAMLLHVQLPGASFVAPPLRWLRDYGRRIKPGARPLVILQPMGPVMFVFDVCDTEAVDGHSRLPPEVDRPFEPRDGSIGKELDRTIRNARRDGVSVHQQQQGSQSAGMIRTVPAGRTLEVEQGTPGRRQYIAVALRFELLLNSSQSSEAQFGTLVHELAHLYCGHLGTPDPSWWPDRRGLPHAIEEFEAESVSYLVCRRAGVTTTSETYLASFVDQSRETPDISLGCVMKSAGLLETMGHGTLPMRKPQGNRGV